MKRNIITLVIISVIVSAAAGCTYKNDAPKVEVGKTIADTQAADDYDADKINEKKEPDCKEIAEALLNNISYGDELSEVDLDTAGMFLNISGIDIVESCIYESSGATAEEIIVLKCKDSDNAAKAKDMLSARVSEQTESFTDYVPEEVPKLKDAVIIKSKEYAVLSVSGDSGKAKAIIEEAFK